MLNRSSDDCFASALTQTSKSNTEGCYTQERFNLLIKGLARILKQLGENQFKVIWREVTGEDCTGKLHEAIWAVRDRLETE
ncbi:MAG: hypothetical protein KME57_08640 [Scytonema hyalinum WJT4-NPBG1]|nr:hypothetical protein [Scytonema hyalinum WJT4-NPBG1]